MGRQRSDLLPGEGQITKRTDAEVGEHAAEPGSQVGALVQRSVQDIALNVFLIFVLVVHGRETKYIPR